MPRRPLDGAAALRARVLREAAVVAGLTAVFAVVEARLLSGSPV